jgi:alkanesulfonate monooxygenase SsuD/methylene tetrahydromethanopterin reductase-like flavin-dependent oxidoreductase (luciferase family)
MQFGLFMMPLHPPYRAFADCYDRDIDQMTSTKLTPSMLDEAVTVDYLMEHVWIVGDPSECADKIHQIHEESGGFGTLWRSPPTPTMPAGTTRACNS